MVHSGSRQARLRDMTTREITQTARRILADSGPEAVTLRATARAMGMTGPALYRYFGNHRKLLEHLVGEIFTSLTDDLQTALHAASDRSTVQKFVTVASRFRRWSLDHKHEYALLFGTPIPGLETDENNVAAECARRFGCTFLTLLIKVWEENPFPILADEDIGPALYTQLAEYRDDLGATSLPVGVMVVVLSCWIRLQGFVSLEVFGHMRFATSDATPMFELMLAEVAADIGWE